MNNNIVMINRSKLQPHPDNPRKDLGDLTELANSIAEHGIMQNLTVVPFGDCYRVLIGHRRLEASKGIIDELPCVIADNLTDREQVGIMLVENMQRSDLTYMEQAHGFQMMLDLGDTVETIAEKTGFSKATVKHRLAINEIDQDALAEASKYFQPTIADFIELEKVKDLERRNEILREATDSKEIADDVAEWVAEQKRAETFALYKKVFDELGWQEFEGYFNYGTNCERVNDLDVRVDNYEQSFVDKVKRVAATLKGEVYYAYKWDYLYFAIKIEKKKDEKKKKTKAELREEEMKKKASELEKARTTICDEYVHFILNFPKDRLKKLIIPDRLRMFERCWNIFEDLRCYVGNIQIFNLKTNDKDQLEELGEKYIEMDTLLKVLMNVWAALASNYSNRFVDYNHVKREDVLDAHNCFYSILYFFGFRLNDELTDVIEGESDLYLIDGKEVKS